MSSFCAVLAEQILTNLRIMNSESESSLTFTGFACIRFVIQIVLTAINYAPSE